MAYVVDRVVICDAFREPDRYYQLLAGGRSKLAMGRRPSDAISCLGEGTRRAALRVSLAKRPGLFEDLLV